LPTSPTPSATDYHTKMAVPPSSLKLGFYRQCRLWHGYLSAFAFGALLFFAATGMALNHPNWFAANESQGPLTTLTLTSSQLQQLRQAQAPGPLLTRMVAEQMRLYGEYQDGATELDQIFVRLRGARGSSDIRANLRDGSIIVVSGRATALGLLNALHRGDQTGAAWRTFIDVAAGMLIVLSLVGYAIFFSMSARLTTALLITGISTLGIVIFYFVVVH
jgi:uncharacterized protein